MSEDLGLRAFRWEGRKPAEFRLPGGAMFRPVFQAGSLRVVYSSWIRVGPGGISRREIIRACEALEEQSGGLKAIALEFKRGALGFTNRRPIMSEKEAEVHQWARGSVEVTTLTPAGES